MDIAQAFPVYDVRLFREEAEEEADDYSLIRVEGNSLALEAPASRVRHDPPAEGEAVLVQSAHRDAAYRVRVRVTQCSREDYVTLTVRQDGDIQCIQRRKHFRVLAGIPLKLEVGGADKVEPIEIRTEDISSAGARVLSPLPFDANAELLVTLDLGHEVGAITTKARAVRCRTVEGELYDIGIEFINLAEDDREQLIDILLRRVLSL